MATNFKQHGDHLVVEAPSGGVASGQLVVINKLFGVAQTDAASGDSVVLATGGVYELPKTNAASMSMAVGAYAYWDARGGKATTSATSNTLIGVALAAVGNTDATVKVRLNHDF